MLLSTPSVSSSPCSSPTSLFEISTLLNNRGVDLYDSGDVETARKCFKAAIYKLRGLLHDLQAQRRHKRHQRHRDSVPSEQEPLQQQDQRSADMRQEITHAAEIEKDQGVETRQATDTDCTSSSLSETSQHEVCSESSRDQPSLHLHSRPLRILLSNQRVSEANWELSSNAAAIITFNIGLTHHLLSMNESSAACLATVCKHRQIAMTFYDVSMDWRRLGRRPKRQKNRLLAAQLTLLDLSTLNNVGVLFHQEGNPQRCLLNFENLYSLLVLLDAATTSESCEVKTFINNLNTVLPFKASFSASAA